MTPDEIAELRRVVVEQQPTLQAGDHPGWELLGKVGPRLLEIIDLASRALPAAPDAGDEADAIAGLVTANDEAAAVKIAVLALASRIRDQAKREAYAWRPIETAPHDVNVLMAWPDLTLDAGWRIETGMASWGWRRGGVSNMSRHGQATHWAPLQPPPAIEALAEKKP